MLAILSGPEPHRSLLEEELMHKLSVLPGKHVIVRGTNKKRAVHRIGTIEVYDMLASHDLQELINKSSFLVSRSGYSGIMDFVQLGRCALLIPTPGQTEQEYLANYHSRSRSFVVQKQGAVNLNEALNKMADMQGLRISNKNQDLNQTLVDFLDSLY